MSDKIKEVKDLLFEFDSKHSISVTDTHDNISNIAEKIVKLFAIPDVSGTREHDYVRLKHTTFVKCSKCSKVMKEWEVKHYR